MNFGNILSQQAIDCKIVDVESAAQLLEAIGYKQIMHIKETDFGYTKDEFTICTKNIENGDNLIEIETNEKYDTIEKLKEKLLAENISIDISNLFVKKAEIELNKVLGRNVI